jgi:branched-chain amino acid transport system permease protein
MTTLPIGIRVLLLGFVVLLALAPPLGDLAFPAQHAFVLQKLTGILILAILAMSLDLLVGIAGMVSLGHAAFFGLGGYGLALLSPEYAAANLWLVLPAALGIVALIAVPVGLLSIRTSGIAFIMVTLAFGQMGYYLFNDSRGAGGSDGLFIMERPSLDIAGRSLVSLSDPLTFYYFVLLAFLGTYVLLRQVLASPFGRVLAAIGVNEGRVGGLGFDARRYKLVAFVLGATLAGLSGVLAAAQYGFVNPSMLSWHHSGEALVMVILGGMGTLFGPAIGAFVFELARLGFESMTDHWPLLMGGMVIAIVMLLPRGIAGLLLDLARRGGPRP